MVNKQLLVLVGGIVIFILALGFLKKAKRIITCIAVVLIVAMLYIGLAPRQIFNSKEAIQEKGLAYYEKIANESSLVRLENGKIFVNASDTWVDVDSITSVVEVFDSSMKFKVDTETYEVTNNVVVTMLKTLYNH